MQPIIKFNGTIISIEIIDDEGTHYKKDIPNNDINKKLIKNTVFKFEKSGTQTIIMHDDNNVFHLSKMECKYSDYIKMQNKLENTEKEMVNFKNDLLQQMKNEMVNFKNELFDTNNLLTTEIDMINSKLNDTDSLLQHQMKILKDKHKKEIDNLKDELNNLLQKQIEKVNDKSVKYTKDTSQLNNDLQQQIKEINYYLPFVFKFGSGNYDRTHYGNEQIVTYKPDHDAQYYQFFNSQKDIKLTILNTNRTFIVPNNIYEHIIIPPGKVLISISIAIFERGLKVYNKGIHYNIKLGDFIMFINEKNIDNIIALYKKEQTIQKFGNLSITYIESECLQE